MEKLLIMKRYSLSMASGLSVALFLAIVRVNSFTNVSIMCPLFQKKYPAAS